jgi:shikimate kinase
MTISDKSIVFIGFMGSGKTTIGKIFAEKLGRPFIDIDKEIENEYGVSTTQIFQTFGEKVFREQEKQLITKFCNEKSSVISVGGGAFLQKEVQEFCMSKCIVIYLDISFENWKERLASIIDSRPILQGLTLEDMKTLFYKRQELYNAHHIKINIDNLDVHSITNLVIESLDLP